MVSGMTRTKGAKGHDRVELYLADDGWRWRYLRSNGKCMADSGEAYTRRASGRLAAEHLFDLAWETFVRNAASPMTARVLRSDA